jgi:transposase-like protein
MAAPKKSVTGACTGAGQPLGINRDTLRGWVKQAQIDAGAKPGLSINERKRRRSSRLRTVSCGGRTRSVTKNAPNLRVRGVHDVLRHHIGVNDGT